MSIPQLPLIRYGQLSSSVSLPVGVPTASAKQSGESFSGTLIRGSDSPNNTQQFHTIPYVTDVSNLGNMPELGDGDGEGYILTEYHGESETGELATVLLTYSAQSAYTPFPTSTDQASTKEVSITAWPDFATAFGNGAAPLNGAVFASSQSTAQFLYFLPDAAYGGSNFAGWETFPVATCVYTYTDYSTSEFDSDAELCGTIQSPDGSPPTLPEGGSWLLDNSGRGKTGYFYCLTNTSISGVNLPTALLAP